MKTKPRGFCCVYNSIGKTKEYWMCIDVHSLKVAKEENSETSLIHWLNGHGTNKHELCNDFQYRRNVKLITKNEN